MLFVRNRPEIPLTLRFGEDLKENIVVGYPRGVLHAVIPHGEAATIVPPPYLVVFRHLNKKLFVCMCECLLVLPASLRISKSSKPKILF